MRTVTACGCALVSVAECCPDQAAPVNAICKVATERRVIFAQDNVLGVILASERPLHRPHERLDDGGDARQDLERHAEKR